MKNRTARQFKKAILLAALLVLPPVQPALSADDISPDAIAIVVHKESSVENLSMEVLRNIFLANQQFWPDRTRIILLVRAPKSNERDFVLDTIYEMDEARFRQYWIAKMFRSEVPRGPKIVFSTDMTLELVIAIPGSISFINANDVTNAVRTLRIDGKLPADADYPLK